MNKIIKLSDNGFQLDTGMEFIGPKWFTCDKYKIFKNPAKTALFNSLKVGDELTDLKFNKGKDGKYVIDFKVSNSNSSATQREKSDANVGTNVKVNVSEGGSKVPTPSDTLIQSGKHVLESDGGCYSPQKATALNSNIEPSSVQVSKDGRIYGQCVNLAFNNLNSQEVALNFKTDKGYPNIRLGFDIADELYAEYVKRFKMNVPINLEEMSIADLTELENLCRNERKRRFD